MGYTSKKNFGVAVIKFDSEDGRQKLVKLLKNEQVINFYVQPKWEPN